MNPAHWQKYNLRMAQNKLIENHSRYSDNDEVVSFTSVPAVIQNLRYRNIYQLSWNMQSIQSKACRPYMTFDNRASHTKFVSVRTYRGIGTMLSELGGFSSLIYFIFYNITSLYLMYTKTRLFEESIYNSMMANENNHTRRHSTDKPKFCDKH